MTASGRAEGAGATRGRDTGSVRREAAVVLVLLAFAYGYFPKDPEDNGNSRLDLVYAMVEEGRFTIDTFHDQPETPTGDKAYRAGHYYSDKAPGTAFMGAPVYFALRSLAHLGGASPSRTALRAWLTFLVIGVPSAAAGALLFALARVMGAERNAAFAATIAIFLGTMLFPYSTMYYSHAVTAALLLAAFAVVLAARGRGTRIDTVRAGAVVGFLLGMSVVTEATAFVLVPALVAYYLRAMADAPPPVRWRAPLASMVLAASVPVAAMLAYDTLCFGSPLANGYAYHWNRYYRTAMTHGVMGVGWPSRKVLFYLTLHPATGVFWHSPVLLLVIPALTLLGARPGCRREALVIGWSAFMLLLLNAGYFMWWGGHAFGPRHLVAVLPLAGLPLALLPRRMLPLTILLTAVSVAQMLIVTAANPQVPDDRIHLLQEAPLFDYSPIYSRCLRDLLADRWAENLGRSVLGLDGMASLTPLLVVIGAAMWWASRRGPMPPPNGAVSERDTRRSDRNEGAPLADTEAALHREGGCE